jgi:hypothetical protein
MAGKDQNFPGAPFAGLTRQLAVNVGPEFFDYNCRTVTVSEIEGIKSAPSARTQEHEKG